MFSTRPSSITFENHLERMKESIKPIMVDLRQFVISLGSNVIEWCHVGPTNSRVDDVDVRFEKYSGEFASFTINNN